MLSGWLNPSFPVIDSLLLADFTPPADLLQTLLDVSLTGVIVFRPVFAADGVEIVDLAYVRLNPAAQRMLRLPELPARTFLQLYPNAVKAGIFAFYRDTFLDDKPGRYQIDYTYDGLDNYFHLAAQRSGPLLVVSFTDTADHGRTNVEIALRESQTRERAARAEAEAQRQQLHDTLMQAPAMICIFRGPDHIFELVNPPYQRLVGERPLLGRPIREAMPELEGQPIFGLLDGVYRTGTTFSNPEMLVQLDHENVGAAELEERYYNLMYQARRDAAGAIDGILVFATGVSAQVRARQRVEAAERQQHSLNQALAATNAELRAVTTTVQQARADADAARQELHELVMHAPACIAVLKGPNHTFTLINPYYERLVGGRKLVGLPIRRGLPELEGQPFFDLLGDVYRTGETYYGNEATIYLDRTNSGHLDTSYFNFVYQATHDAHGRVDGILIFAHEVTEQVLARRRVEESEQSLAVTHDELAATNEELRATNQELYLTESRLREFNQQLEARVQRRTAELQAAMRETEQQREQIHLQRLQLQQILGEVPASIATVTGPEHRFAFYNASYDALVGGRVGLGRTVAETLPEIVGQGFITLLDQVYATGQAFTAVEAPIKLQNSATGQPETRYIDFIYQPLADGQGQTQGILAFVVDTTEKVRARQLVEVQQRQLQTLFEQAPVAIAVFRGPRHVVEVANPSACALWGRTPEQVLGRPLFESLPEVGEQGFAELLDDVAASGEAFAAQAVPIYFNRPSGAREAVYLNFVYQPLRDADGVITSIASVATDVSEQVRARRQLEYMTDELAAANRTLLTANAELGFTNEQLTRVNADLDTFIYTASHDLRAPIVNIDGLIAALEQELPAPARQASSVAPLLTMMHDAVARFQKTLDQLTDITKLQKTHDQPTTHVNLAAIIEEVRLDLAPQIAAAGAELAVDVGECPSVPFAAKHLRSVVYNLLSNALKYRDPARPLQVHISCRGAGEFAVLTVQDNGLGLSRSRQKELFTMFKRFHIHVEGSGVGLYMLKRIVQNAGGRVEVESEVGVGSTFRVFIRLHELGVRE